MTKWHNRNGEIDFISNFIEENCWRDVTTNKFSIINLNSMDAECVWMNKMHLKNGLFVAARKSNSFFFKCIKNMIKVHHPSRRHFLLHLKKKYIQTLHLFEMVANKLTCGLLSEKFHSTHISMSVQVQEFPYRRQTHAQCTQLKNKRKKQHSYIQQREKSVVLDKES